MQSKVLSIFVDESGRFQLPDEISRFYIVSLVLHNQGASIVNAVSGLMRDMAALGFPHHYFHCGPLIRKEKGYQFMSWEIRNRIFARMAGFARQLPFHYHCLVVDKKFVSSKDQIMRSLEDQLAEFLSARKSHIGQFQLVKVYYDCGQSEVTNLLHSVLERHFGGEVEFAQGVQPEKYALFQVSDLICSLKLIEAKIDNGIALTQSEARFFGGVRLFRRNILKKFKPKEI